MTTEIAKQIEKHPLDANLPSNPILKTMDKLVSVDQSEIELRTAATAFEGRINSAEAALSFTLAGNSYFTLRSQKSGIRFTYHVSKAKEEKTQMSSAFNRAGVSARDTWFVSVLTGPENTENYSYIGIIRSDEFHHTRKSKLAPNTPSVKAFEWAFRHISHWRFPEQLEFWHEGKCGRCGRKLTVPESVASGYGPECVKTQGEKP